MAKKGRYLLFGTTSRKKMSITKIGHCVVVASSIWHARDLMEQLICINTWRPLKEDHIRISNNHFCWENKRRQMDQVLIWVNIVLI